VTIPKER